MSESILRPNFPIDLSSMLKMKNAFESHSDEKGERNGYLKVVISICIAALIILAGLKIMKREDADKQKQSRMPLL